MSQPSITCPICHLTSYHPKDIEQGYCGHCHDWTGKPTLHHMLKENAVVVRKGGCEASCVCGWRSEPRPTLMIASMAFRVHYTEATGRDYDADMYGGKL